MTVAERLAVLDVGVNVLGSDGSWGLVSPGKEQFEVVGVVDVCGRFGAASPQPLAEACDFR